MIDSELRDEVVELSRELIRGPRPVGSRPMTSSRQQLWLGLIATAAALALAGCGGDDEAASDEVTASSASTCLTDAGLDVVSEPPTSDEMVGSLFINADQFDQVYVAFMTDGEAAQQFEKGIGGLAAQAGGNAGSELVGETIVLARARDTTQKQVDEVKACLGG